MNRIISSHIRLFVHAPRLLWEGEVKASAAGRLVDRPQASTMRFDDGTADPKSHAGPLRLGGKERIKI